MSDTVVAATSIGRSPHGERGLKCRNFQRLFRGFCRSPHGERGLKSSDKIEDIANCLVALLTESVD